MWQIELYLLWEWSGISSEHRDLHLNSSLPMGCEWGTSILEAWFISCQSRSIVSLPKSAHYFPGRCSAPLEAVSLQTLRVWWDESHPLSFRACLYCTLQSYLWYKLVSSYIMMQKSKLDYPGHSKRLSFTFLGELLQYILPFDPAVDCIHLLCCCIHNISLISFALEEAI